MNAKEIRSRILELAKLEAEAIAENDSIMFRHHRARRNVLEEKLSALK